MTGTPAATRVLIVDDEALARKRLHALLADVDDVVIIGEADSGRRAVQAIRESLPDLVLLDIQMPGMDGFEVLEAIADVSPHPVIVFVTAHDEHALRAFEFEAVDYVLKPVMEDRLRDAVRRAVVRRRQQSQADVTSQLAQMLARVRMPSSADRIAIKTDGRVRFIGTGEIDWVDADRDLVRIHAGKDVHQVRMTMSELESMLDARHFARVHRSSIVNIARIREIQPWFKGDYVIIMRDGTNVRTGRSYRGVVQALIGNAR